VINAVAFQLDKRLRPILGPVRDGLFELANAIFEGNFSKAESIIKDFVDAIASVNFTQLFGSITDAVDGILKKIRSAFDGATAKGIVDKIFGLLGGFVQFAVNRVAGFIKDVVKALSGKNVDNVLAEFLVDGLGALVNLAAQATEKIANFLGGLDYQRLINEIIGSLIFVSDVLTDGITDLIRTLNWDKITSQFATEFAASIKSGYNDAISEFQREVTGIFLPDEFIPNTDTNSPTQQQQQSPGIATTTNNASGGSVQLDGFEVNKRIGRYAQGEVANRGGTTGI
jgi:hypothetical protein